MNPESIKYLIALLVFQRFPITPEVHAGIRAQLDVRAAGERQRLRLG